MSSNHNHMTTHINAKLWSDSIIKYDGMTKNEIDSANSKIKETSKELRNKILFMQGLVLDLQRKAGKAEDFDRSIYNDACSVGKYLDNLIEEFSGFKEQIEYTKDIIDSVKVSQELSEGFETKLQFDYNTLFNGVSISSANNNVYTTSSSNGWISPKHTFELDGNLTFDKISDSDTKKGKGFKL